MYLSILTAPYNGGDWSLEQICQFAHQAGYKGLEIFASKGSKVLDPHTCDTGQVKALLDQYELKASAVVHYADLLNPNDGQAHIEDLKKCIEIAPALGTDVVCTLAGLPKGKSKEDHIREDAPKIFKPLLNAAKDKGVKIGLENWTATLMQNLDHWRLMFETIPDDNFGLNFDPSHLYWMQIDYFSAVFEFQDRIFTTHGKDTLINYGKLRSVGNNGHGWWRYVIPGFGEIQWGKYINCLRQIGYRGAISIEHEDPSFGREEGFVAAQKYLSTLV